MGQPQHRCSIIRGADEDTMARTDRLATGGIWPPVRSARSPRRRHARSTRASRTRDGSRQVC